MYFDNSIKIYQAITCLSTGRTQLYNQEMVLSLGLYDNIKMDIKLGKKTSNLLLKSK